MFWFLQWRDRRPSRSKEHSDLPFGWLGYDTSHKCGASIKSFTNANASESCFDEFISDFDAFFPAFHEGEAREELVRV